MAQSFLHRPARRGTRSSGRSRLTRPLVVEQLENRTLLSGDTCVACVPPPAGLIASWSGDGDATDIVGGNNGVLSGDAGFTSGLVNQAFSFSGNGDVTIADSATFKDLTSGSIEFWVKFDELPSVAGQRMSILAKNQGGTNNGDVIIRGLANDSFSAVFDDGTGITGPGGISIGAGPIVANTFTHVAFTWANDGIDTTITSYRNGVEQEVKTTSNIIRPLGVDAVLQFGRGDLQLLNGRLDEVDIYNRALSAAELQAIFNADSAGKCKGGSVEIDIRPGGNPNNINLKSKGRLPVVIRTTSTAAGDAVDFDATTVDTSTIEFGDTRSDFRVSAVRTATEDVDGDGDLDLILHFSMRQIKDNGALDADSVDAILTAKTQDDTDVFGIDLVRIVHP